MLVALAMVPATAESRSPHWGKVQVAVRAESDVPRAVIGAAIDDRRNALLVLSEGGQIGPEAAKTPLRTTVRRGVGGGRFGPASILHDGFEGDTVVSNGSGDVLVFWHDHRECGRPAFFCPENLWMASGTVAKGLGAAVRLSGDLLPLATPSAALNARGDAMVAWPELHDDRTSDLRVTYRSGRAAFGGVQVIRGTSAGTTRAGIDARGNALLSWFNGQTDGAAIQAMWIAPGGSLGAIQTIFAGKNSEHASGPITFGPLAAVTPNGTAMVMWSGRWRSGDTTGPTGVATGRAGGSVKVVRAHVLDTPIELVSGPRGGFAALFSDQIGGSFTRSPRFDVTAAVADGTRFARAQTLVGNSRTNLSTVVLDGAGDALVGLGSSHGVRVAIRPRGGRFGRAQSLSRQGGGPPRFAVNRRGDTLATWSAGKPGANRIEARIRRR